MPLLTIELPDSLADRLAELASERGLATEEIARELLDIGLSGVPDFIGVARSGRPDLSGRAKALRQAGIDRQSILDRGEELATRFEEHEPKDDDLKDATALRALRAAFRSRAAAEFSLYAAVAAARARGHAWTAIGAMTHSSGTTARRRYENRLSPPFPRRPTP